MINQHNDPEDYVQISSISRIVKQFLRFLFWFWAFLLLVLKKNLGIVLAGLVIGLLLGAAYYYTKPKLYKTAMVVQFNELTKKTYAEMLNQLNGLVASGSAGRLSQELNISSEAAAELGAIEAKNMNDEALNSDTSTKTRQNFKINVTLRSGSHATEIQNGILYQLNNSPYLKRLREEQSKLYRDRVAFIEQQLAKMDTLKTEYNRFIASSKGSSTFYNNEFNPADLYAQSSALYGERENLLRWLNIDKDAVTLIDGFKTTSSPNSTSLFKALLILGAAGLLIAYLVAFLRETRKRVA